MLSLTGMRVGAQQQNPYCSPLTPFSHRFWREVASSSISLWVQPAVNNRETTREERDREREEGKIRKFIYVENAKAWVSVRRSVRLSEVCDFFSENVPKINKKGDFYDMNAKYPFHRVTFGFPQKAWIVNKLCCLKTGLVDIIAIAVAVGFLVLFSLPRSCFSFFTSPFYYFSVFDVLVSNVITAWALKHLV